MNDKTGLETKDLKSLIEVHSGPLTAVINVFPLKDGNVYVELAGTEKLRIPEQKDEKPSK